MDNCEGIEMAGELFKELFSLKGQSSTWKTLPSTNPHQALGQSFTSETVYSLLSSRFFCQGMDPISIEEDA